MSLSHIHVYMPISHMHNQADMRHASSESRHCLGANEILDLEGILMLFQAKKTQCLI